MNRVELLATGFASGGLLGYMVGWAWGTMRREIFKQHRYGRNRSMTCEDCGRSRQFNEAAANVHKTCNPRTMRGGR